MHIGKINLSVSALAAMQDRDFKRLSPAGIERPTQAVLLLSSNEKNILTSVCVVAESCFDPDSESRDLDHPNPSHQVIVICQKLKDATAKSLSRWWLCHSKQIRC